MTTMCSMRASPAGARCASVATQPARKASAKTAATRGIYGLIRFLLRKRDAARHLVVRARQADCQRKQFITSHAPNGMSCARDISVTLAQRMLAFSLWKSHSLHTARVLLKDSRRGGKRTPPPGAFVEQ